MHALGDFLLIKHKLNSLTSPQWLKFLPRPYDMLYFENPSHMLLVWSLSFVKLLWPMWDYSHAPTIEIHLHPPNKLPTLILKSCAQTCTPSTKNANSYPESCAPVHQIKRPTLTLRVVHSLDTKNLLHAFHQDISLHPKFLLYSKRELWAMFP